MAKRPATPTQMSLPGAIELKSAGKTIPMRNNQIPHTAILRSLQNSTEGPGVSDIYRERVLPTKTRTIRLLGRKSSARIIHTLLGYEVQASRKRIHCPDLVTARYLKLFTELGCRSVRLPYDPTVTAAILPDLERAIERIQRGVQKLFPRHEARRYVLERIYRLIRKQLDAA